MFSYICCLEIHQRRFNRCFVSFECYLPRVVHQILPRDVALAVPIDTLEGGVWLEGFQFAEGLAGELNLHLCLARVNEQLGESFLREYGHFL